MTFILKFLRYNDMIASTLGILSNLFLIFLIFTVNKPHLKQMSYTLLQNCYLDLLLAVITLISEPGNIRLIMAFGVMCSCSVVSYFLIIYFSIKIIRHLSQSHIHMSKRTKQLNKQLLKTLAVQAIGPLVTGNFPMCCTIVMIFFQYENHYVTLGLSCLLGWVAVINPVAATLIIKPYRKRVKQLLRLKRGDITSTLETPSVAASKPNSTNIYTINAASVNPMHANIVPSIGSIKVPTITPRNSQEEIYLKLNKRFTKTESLRRGDVGDTNELQKLCFV